MVLVAVPALAQQGSLTLPVGTAGDTRILNFAHAVEGTPQADVRFF